MIKQAIIPLAGLGTRLLPLTSVIPKELLPINGRPGLEYILEECMRSGITKIVFIISKKKKSIRDYFYNDKLYIKTINNKKNDRRLKKEFLKLKKYRKIIKFVYQDNPKGTGDAVLKCMKHITSDYFLMLMPDDLIINKNCSSSLIKLHRKYRCSIIAAKKVSKKDVSRWGIFNKKKISKKDFLIKDVIEKPSLSEAPSNYAVIGRYVLSKKIFQILKKQKPGKNGEIHITDSIRTLILKKNKFVGHIFDGKYLDCGSMKGYIKSSLEISKL